MRFAGQRQGHHGAAVKCIFESDHARTAGVSTRDFDPILDRFRARIYQQSFLGKVSRRDAVQPFCEADIVLVGSDLRTGVQKTLQLRL